MDYFFLQRNSTKKDMLQGILNFLFVFMELKYADNMYSNNKEPLFNPTDILIQPSKQILTYILSQVCTEYEVGVQFNHLLT